MEIFRSSIYWSIVLPILYINLALFLLVVIREFIRTLKKETKLWLLLIPLLLLIPIGLNYGPNAFMHLGFAKSISDKPFTWTYCVAYSGGNCVNASTPPWSPAYHILLSKFLYFSDFGVILLNSLLLFTAIYFFYKILKNQGINGVFSFLIFSPQIITFFKTPNLEFFSMMNFVMLFYFLLKKDATPTLISAVNLLHIRAENFVLLLVLLPRILPLIKGAASWLFLGSNALLKVFEFLRGWSSSPEWTPPIRDAIVALLNYLPRNLVFSLDPIQSNFLWFSLAFLGMYFAYKKNKDFIILPFLAFLIYTVHFSGVDFYTNSASERVLIQVAVVSLPLVVLSLKKLKPKGWMLLPLIIPFLFLNWSNNGLSDAYLDSIQQKDYISAMASNLSMTVYSYSPWVFASGNSVMVSDVFFSASGDYLFPSYKTITLKPSNKIKITLLEKSKNLYLFNLTYFGQPS